MAKNVFGLRGQRLMRHRVSFVIASRDEPHEMLAATIQGLQITTPGQWREIIVVDDASLVPVSFLHPEVQVVRNPIALGCSPSRQIGSRLATGDVLVFMDPHMSFVSGWLEEMLRYVGSGSLLCSPWSEYEGLPIYSFGADYQWIGRNGLSFGYRRIRPHRRYALVPMVIGACYMVARATYDRLGGFCPHFRIWGLDEQDLSSRAWLAGFEVACVTRAQVGHRGSFQSNGARRSPWAMPKGQVHANNLVLFRSNFESKTQRLLEDCLGSLDDGAQALLDSLDFEEWKDSVQAVRKITDAEFFARFGKRLPRYDKRGRLCPGLRVKRTVDDEEEFFLESLRVQESPLEANSTRSLDCFGVHFCFEGDADLISELLAHCPCHTALQGVASPRVVITVGEEPQGCFVDFGEHRVLTGLERHSLGTRFQKSLMFQLVYSSPLVFLKAAVLEVDDEVLILVGAEADGTWSLVAALIGEGAHLVSDRYLVLGADGKIHSFCFQNSLLPFTAREPWKAYARLVVETHLRPKSRWRPKAVPASVILPRLLGRPQYGAAKQKIALTVTPSLCARATFLKGPRGCARKAAKAIFRRLRA